MEQTAWIATSEQEPEFGKEVLLCTEDSEGRRRIIIGELTRDFFYVRYSLGEGAVNLQKHGERVTHWMPLPSLPR